MPLLHVAFAWPEEGPTLPLPRLRSLDLRAPMVSLPRSFSQLAALTQLSVSGYLLEFEPGCLPPGLASLEVEWRRTMTPVTTEPFHLAELEAAACAAGGIARLRIAGALAVQGLGGFGPALSSLEWSGGYIPSLEVPSAAAAYYLLGAAACCLLHGAGCFCFLLVATHPPALLTRLANDEEVCPPRCRSCACCPACSGSAWSG